MTPTCANCTINGSVNCPTHRHNSPLLPHGDAVEAARVALLASIRSLAERVESDAKRGVFGEASFAAMYVQSCIEDYGLAATAHGRAQMQPQAEDYATAFGYLERLFEGVWPQCDALPTLSGLATQIDNGIAGLKVELEEQAAQLAEQDAEIQRLRALTEPHG